MYELKLTSSGPVFNYTCVHLLKGTWARKCVYIVLKLPGTADCILIFLSDTLFGALKKAE